MRLGTPIEHRAVVLQKENTCAGALARSGRALRLAGLRIPHHEMASVAESMRCSAVCWLWGCAPVVSLGASGCVRQRAIAEWQRRGGLWSVRHVRRTQVCLEAPARALGAALPGCARRGLFARGRLAVSADAPLGSALARVGVVLGVGFILNYISGSFSGFVAVAQLCGPCVAAFTQP